MIYIDISKIKSDQDWLDWVERAKALSNKLLDTQDKATRKQIVDNNKKLWKDKILKKKLLELSHGKCWYSEAKDLNSPYDVDHFRPKHSARQLNGEQRDGYWWLAFDWKNYRIAGQFSNRKFTDDDRITRGKGDYFPLKVR